MLRHLYDILLKQFTSQAEGNGIKIEQEFLNLTPKEKTRNEDLCKLLYSIRMMNGIWIRMM